MKSNFYFTLALSNIKKNSKTYIPYILSSILMIIVFHNFRSIIDKPNTGEYTKTLLNIGLYATSIFSAIFLFYTYSFLVKRRKKEFALLNILGLEKKHIVKIIFFETSVVAFVSIFIGLILGEIFNELSTLALYKMIAFSPVYDFTISFNALIVTSVFFIIIFFLTFLSSTFKIMVSNPTELLSGAKNGEKMPRGNIFLSFLGLLFLGTGYYLAVTIKDPLEALNFFFIAVLLVMLGTYLLFISVSIYIFKLLKKNKKFYYKTKNFVNVSSLMYRIKKNAVGLSNICLASTAVLVAVTSTFSLYSNVEKSIERVYPRDISLHTSYENFDEENIAKVSQVSIDYLETQGINTQNYINYTFIDAYLSDSTNESNLIFLGKNEERQSVSTLGLLNVYTQIVPQSLYETLTGKSLDLAENEVAIYNYPAKDTINILGKDYNVVETTDDFGLPERLSGYITCIVVDSEDTIKSMANDIAGFQSSVGNTLMFDLNDNLSEEEKLNLYYESMDIPLYEYIETTDVEFKSYSFSSRQDFAFYNYEIFGSFLFLGMYLGLIFFVMMVLIIYYKQIVEGYEDKDRFKIMKNIGMSEKEVKGSIRSQILMIFSAPIIIAILHMTFASPLLNKILVLLNNGSQVDFTLPAIVVSTIFSAVYAVVYFLTSRVYNKIVNS